MDFAIIHCMKKNNRLLIFIMVMSLSLLWESYQSMHNALSRPLLAGSDDTIISYYSNKKLILCENIPSKNEVINARVY